MTYSVSVPMVGLAGWQFLKSTEARQKDAIAEAAPQKRDIAYFRDKMPTILSVGEFVNDPRLMRIALGAFGLEGDALNRAFIERIITDGTSEPEALANRLADKTYLAFAEAFPISKLNGSDPLQGDELDAIISSYNTRRYESSVGVSSEDLRVALYLERGLSDLIASAVNDETMYFRVLGDPPLRLAFETAFGLPGTFASIDIDQQAETLANAVSRRFGTSSLAQFEEQEQRDRLIQLFLVRASVPETSSKSIAAQTALTLLTS